MLVVHNATSHVMSFIIITLELYILLFFHDWNIPEYIELASASHGWQHTPILNKYLKLLF